MVIGVHEILHFPFSIPYRPPCGGLFFGPALVSGFFVHPNHHGTVFALKQWLHHREAMGRVWRAQKCIALVGAENPLTRAGPKTSPLHGERYGIDNEKMQNFVHPNHHGTVFALKQWLHHREATSMESSKMYCPRRCRKPTYPCRAEK